MEAKGLLHVGRPFEIYKVKHYVVCCEGLLLLCCLLFFLREVELLSSFAFLFHFFSHFLFYFYYINEINTISDFRQKKREESTCNVSVGIPELYVQLVHV